MNQASHPMGIVIEHLSTEPNLIRVVFSMNSCSLAAATDSAQNAHFELDA